MLIILPKPKEIAGYHILAINLETVDEIIVSENIEHSVFSLAIVRYFDAHHSNQSLSHYTLGAFESSEACLATF